MPQYFTRAQAEQLLPRIEQTIREGLVLKADFQEADQILKSAARAVSMSGGMNVNRERLLAARQQRDTSATKLQAALEFIHSQGCQVKDLDIGLLDFPTLYHGREVYLCWKLGEERIDFWHEVDAGYRGRRPIDAEFLENHTGDD